VLAHQTAAELMAEQAARVEFSSLEPGCGRQELR
jgi:hypothetical protein